MKPADSEGIVRRLSYEGRLAFVAHCVDRCLGEAERHPRARRQLPAAPWLRDGRQMLWEVAEGQAHPDASKAEDLSKHLYSFETATSPTSTAFRFDIILVKTAVPLLKGLNLLMNPRTAEEIVVLQLDGLTRSRVSVVRYAAGAPSGPVMVMGAVYEAGMASRNAEEEHLDAALRLLDAFGNKPISRSMFAALPDWERGAVAKAYLRGYEGSDDL